jgi:hypothetical protein
MPPPLPPSESATHRKMRLSPLLWMPTSASSFRPRARPTLALWFNSFAVWGGGEAMGEGSYGVVSEPRALSAAAAGPRGGGAPVLDYLAPWCHSVRCRHNHHVSGRRYRADHLVAGPRRPPQLLPCLLVRVSSPLLLVHARCSTEFLLYIFVLDF